jgi:hypothetical protein
MTFVTHIRALSHSNDKAEGAQACLDSGAPAC